LNKTSRSNLTRKKSNELQFGTEGVGIKPRNCNVKYDARQPFSSLDNNQS